ncbi:MAG TPA: YhcH/YjgK/YiaL family protein [Bacteroidales bacterium]
MIADLLENADLYAHMDDRMAVALKYLQSTDLSKLEIGKHIIEDNEVYAMVSEYNSKNPEDAKWEAHQKYADIQCIISGEEKMGFAPLNAMQVKEAYNAEKDIIILKGTGDYVTAKPGTFIVFFPQDAHQPCVAIKGNVPVRKVVVKVMM